MSSSDKYILVTESQNSEEGVAQIETSAKEESDSAALRALENQGIFLEGGDDVPVHAKPRDEFSRELMDESGIEIVSSEEEPFSL